MQHGPTPHCPLYRSMKVIAVDTAGRAPALKKQRLPSGYRSLSGVPCSPAALPGAAPVPQSSGLPVSLHRSPSAVSTCEACRVHSQLCCNGMDCLGLGPIPFPLLLYHPYCSLPYLVRIPSSSDSFTCCCWRVHSSLLLEQLTLQQTRGGSFEMSKRVSGCSRAVKQGDSKNGERENSEGTFSESAHNPRVAPGPWTAGFETENQGKCAGERKSAWTRLKRRDPEGITPRGLALNKNR